MIRVGKVTAALLLIAVGGLLLADRVTGTNHLIAVLQWWPALFILLGLEYLWLNYKYRGDNRGTRLDMGGLFFAVLITALVIGFTQTSWLQNRILSGFKWEFGSVLSGEFGHKFTKEPELVPIDGKTDSVWIGNEYGSASIKAGDTKQVQVEAIVWVDKLSEEEARHIADGVKLNVTGGSTLRIETEAPSYSAGRKPRVQLIVTMPAAYEVDMELALRNGKVEVDKPSIRDKLVIRTTNGSVTVNGVDGNLIANTTNGAIQAISIRGSADLGTSNGSIVASDISGDAIARTSNSSIKVDRVVGKADLVTKNGAITISEAGRSVRAKTVNGAINAASHTIEGNWEFETTNGRIEMKLPGQGDYDISGQGGKPSTDLPLETGLKSIHGKIGTGQHKIKLETTNGSLSIFRMD